jgi:hypothetical protein
MLTGAILAGESITPIVVVEDSDIAITGSHRIQAYHELGMDEEMGTVEISEEDFEAAKQAYGERFGHYYFSEMTEMKEFCGMLFNLTSSDDVRSALEGQI